MIYEEAKSRCGNSHESLMAAVKRGAVKVKEHDGEELYYFPNVVIGEGHRTAEDEPNKNYNSCRVHRNAEHPLWLVLDHR